MDVKTGTQTWSDSKQVSGLKSERLNQMDAKTQKEVLGDQSLGDYLNSVADSNYIPEDQKLDAKGSSKLDKDAFFKLMLTQIKNQDPTNPMKSHEMAAQLAQFTSLEKLSNINETLEGMSSSKSGSSPYEALNFIGKVAAGDSSEIFRNADDSSHLLSFNLPKNAATGELTIKDANKNIVRTLKLTDLKKGENNIKWNGQDGRGLPVREGAYSFSVEARDAGGAKLAVDTEFKGQITGVSFSPKGPILKIGDQTVRMSDIKSIEEPSKSSSNKTPASPKTSPKGANEQTDESQGSPNPNEMALKLNPELKGAVRTQEAQSDIDSVDMSREMKNLISKRVGQ